MSTGRKVLSPTTFACTRIIRVANWTSHHLDSLIMFYLFSLLLSTRIDHLTLF